MCLRTNRSSLPLKETETVTPTETTETDRNGRDSKRSYYLTSTTAEKSATEEAKEDNTPEGKSLEVLHKKRYSKVGVHLLSLLLRQLLTEQLELEGSISEADLEQQSEQRRFVNQVSRDMQRQELDTKPLTIGERAEAVDEVAFGIEPALANVPPEYRKQVTAAVETERTIREAMAQKTADEKAVKQRKANAAVTEGAKNKKIKVPELSGTAQKRT